MKKVNEKLYKLFNDINRHNKKYLTEDKYSREVRKAREYCEKNKGVKNGIKITYSTGVRTYKNFGVYDIEKPNEKTPKAPEVKEKEIDKYAVKYNYIKLMMAKNGE